MKVQLVSHTPDILKQLYLSYRIDYSADKPSEIVIPDEDTIKEFITKRFKTGHLSPLYQIHLYFTVEGISRAASHQIVRHHVGVDFEQQSQRYVNMTDAGLEYVEPPSFGKNARFFDGTRAAGHAYEKAIEEGVPQEDARYLLPNAATTNIKISFNFAALQHFCDLRLCTQAQWEIRKIAAAMRAEVLKNSETSFLGKYLGIKCQSFRMGYCDESKPTYKKCPIALKVVHKSDIVFLNEEWNSKSKEERLQKIKSM